MTQLTFARVLDEADQAHERRRRDILDRHRAHVQTFFDALPVSDKEQLGDWFEQFQFETCAALAAAAGDFRQSRLVTGT